MVPPQKDLPTIYPQRDFVMVGGLRNYAANVADGYRQAGFTLDGYSKALCRRIYLRPPLAQSHFRRSRVVFRVDEAKRGGANALIVWEEVALNELLALPDVEPWKQHPAFGGHVFAPPGTASPRTRRQAFYFEDEGGKEEVTALCKRYLDFLDKMLEDFCADQQPP
jgi:hypothetical protein